MFPRLPNPRPRRREASGLVPAGPTPPRDRPAPLGAAAPSLRSGRSSSGGVPAASAGQACPAGDWLVPWPSVLLDVPGPHEKSSLLDCQGESRSRPDLARVRAGPGSLGHDASRAPGPRLARRPGPPRGEGPPFTPKRVGETRCVGGGLGEPWTISIPPLPIPSGVPCLLLPPACPPPSNVGC